MNKPTIDIPLIASHALGSIESLLAEWLPTGKKQSGEWCALNPTRDDPTYGSFKVNLRSGVWSDFATNDSGGDLVSLYAYLNDCSQLEAAKAVAARLHITTGTSAPPPAAKRKTQNHTWTPIVPVPEDAPDPPKAHPKRRFPDSTWTYYDRDGRTLCHVCRFTTSDGGKDIIPLTYCRNEAGKTDWAWKGLPVPRPLYGLDRLANHPDKPVLIVEGEKCADAGQAALEGYVAISWIGGSNAVGKCDWSPLKGRDIVIWPDNDEPGAKAARAICAACDGSAASIRVCDTPPWEPSGWDIADAVQDGWDTDRLVRFIETAKPHTGSGAPGGGEAGTALNESTPVFPAPASAAGIDITRYRHTDLGSARLFADLYGHELRYNAKPFRCWFWYDGVRWREDRSNRVFEYVDRMIRFIHAAIPNIDEQQRKPVAKWAYTMESMSRQKALVAKAETLQRLAVDSDEFDKNGWLFNLTNCTLDLESGEPVRHDHTAVDYITNLSPVEYDPEATCPGWLHFIDRIFGGDDQLTEFIQRSVGYSLTDDVSEQVLFFAFGTGANGKSVFFEAIKHLLGDYAGKAPTEMLMAQQFAQIPTDVADLRGKRFVVAAEVDEGKRWAESRLKDLTGGDTIKARRMREDFFEFKQTHKLWVFGNHKPILRGTDEGIRRRMRIIPFTVRIPDEEQIPLSELLARFRAESPGILNWALEGYIRWRESGLGLPDMVSDATEEYFTDNDIMLNFLQECCVTGPQAAFSAQGKKLYKAYSSWCDASGLHALAKQAFYRELVSKGFKKRNGTGNQITFDGIDIDNSQEELPNVA